LSSLGPQPIFSDAAIRRFLLAQLSRKEQPAFETALFTNPQLEQRLRLAEFELIDDYAAERLGASDRSAFKHKFLVTTDRENTLEVSTALRKSFAPHLIARPGPSLSQIFAWPKLAWRIAFVVIALVILVAGALVIRKEPELVRGIIPKRLRRPAPVRQPAPQPAHHPANSSEPRGHREESPASPDHEAVSHRFVLRPNVAGSDVPVITLANHASHAVRLELMLEKTELATFTVVVTTSDGQVVHNIPEFRVESADYIDFDVPRDRLRPDDFQVKLTRIDDPHAAPAIYYFRVE
jgi:hypothetical protein